MSATVSENVDFNLGILFLYYVKVLKGETYLTFKNTNSFQNSLSFCYLYMHCTYYELSIICTLLLRVGHPFFSKKHSDLCVLFRSL